MADDARAPAEAPPPATTTPEVREEEEEFVPTLWTVSDDADAADDSGNPPDEPAPAAAAAAERESSPDPSTLVPMSKNARKKLAKREAFLQKKAAKRAKEKEEKAARGAMLKEEHQKKLQAMSAEEREAYETEQREKRERRKREANDAKAKKQASLQSKRGVVVDLEFGHLMDEKALKSLAKQLSFCYVANCRAATPCRLYLTGLTGAMGEVVERCCSGMANWAVIASEKPYIELLAEQKSKLVYLTADSENELTAFSEDDVYVIGGIVDRNKHKNLTLDKANAQGIRHARLPIRDHLKMTGSHVLTVNQTLDIAHAQMELGDWAAALDRAVPTRKRKAGEMEEDGEKGGGEEDGGDDDGGDDGELSE